MPKLLLADDSVTIQRVIELTFAGEDVQVLTAGDGEQAIARIRAERPDIVLADIGMPKRSGYDVAAFVKGAPDLSHIPVLLLTGAFEPVDEDRARVVGCDGVLVKPFEPQHVVGRVRELLQRGADPAGAGPAGSVTRAVSDVPRPAERLAPSRGASGRAGDDTGAPPAAERPPRASNESALDDYFDRLDAAFASMAVAGAGSTRTPDSPRREGPVAERELDWFDVPPAANGDARHASASLPPPAPPPAADPVPVTFASPPGGPEWRTPSPPPAEFPEAAAGVASQPSPAAASEPPADSGSAIADAFAALLAAEQGEAAPAPVRLGSASPAPAVGEELVDAIASRVMERLGTHAARDVVADIVSRVSERLVREEIDRIRSRHR